MKFRDITEFMKWHYSLKLPMELSKHDRKSLTTFFYKVIATLHDEKARPSVFVSDVFHCLIGLSLIKTTLSNRDKENIERLIKERWTSRGFTAVSQDSPYASTLSTKRLLEDVYSTYYCIGILILIESDISEYMSGILSNYSTWLHPSGWIYNSDWTETTIERRLDIEIIQQMLMGLKLGALLDLKLEDLPYNKERLLNLLAYAEKPRYVTSLYHAVSCLKLLQVWDAIQGKCEEDISNYIIAHFNEDEKGFREYKFEDVKLFSYRGMKEGEEGATARHRFHSDFIASSINATTYSLWIGMEGVQGKLLNFLKAKSKTLVEFFEQYKSVGGGYGTPIRIAKYEASFGPDVSPLETCNHIIGSSLTRAL